MLFGRRADFDEVIKYADFSQQVALQKVDKISFSETSISDDFIDELLSRQISLTDNENVVELPTGKTSWNSYKFLKACNEEFKYFKTDNIRNTV